MKPSKDKVYRKVERNKENWYYVKGATTIKHKLRVELQLTLREYVVMDFIFTWHQNNKAPISYGDFWIGTGIYERHLDKTFQRLKEKGLLFKDTDGKVKTTEKWNSQFDSSAYFEELWKLMSTGTKSVAKQAFQKAIKVDTFENIKSGLIKYLEYVAQIDWMSPQHLSTFLNHKLKRWEGPFNADPYKKKVSSSQQKPKVSTGPKSKM